MELKLCNTQNVDDIVSLCQHFQDASRYQFPFAQEFVQRQVSDLLSKENCLTLGLFHEDRLVGVLIGLSTIHPFFNVPFAGELIFWIEPEYRGSKKAIEMIQAYEYWAVNKMNCQMVTMDNQADSLDVLYEKLGYKKTMHQWSKIF